MSEDVKTKPNLVKRILEIVIIIILIPIILINVVVIANSYLNPGHIAGAFGYKPVIVLSGSMEPEFYPGDVILVKDIGNNSSINENDVICYLSGETAVTHRVVGTLNNEGTTEYVTKGDSNNTEDRLTVKTSEIEGIYTGLRFAGLGSFALFVSSTTGIILFIVLPLLLFFAFELYSRRKQVQVEKNRTAELEERLKELEAQKLNSNL